MKVLLFAALMCVAAAADWTNYGHAYSESVWPTGNYVLIANPDTDDSRDEARAVNAWTENHGIVVAKGTSDDMKDLNVGDRVIVNGNCEEITLNPKNVGKSDSKYCMYSNSNIIAVVSEGSWGANRAWRSNAQYLKPTDTDPQDRAIL
eukprot:NODE_2170_length_635_cov_247.834646_g2120_i0.p2 GENE.NODE_2170_length_635_cov_247.834646_g2120_i0~~NODE_2170_length_635_cov_247.834646_g2120_i0.p2  ORF type:complete len:148 (-),score=46.41 NODE_2170_length_635_cov_247.834646_g2120_i0:114-557(-)